MNLVLAGITGKSTSGNLVLITVREQHQTVSEGFGSHLWIASSMVRAPVLLTVGSGFKS
jgi:hypothetical protein